MPKRDWLRHPSVKWLIGIAAIALIGALIASINYRNEHAGQRADAARYDAERSYQETEHRCAVRPNAIARLECLIEEMNATQEQKRSEYDLRAQQEMAEWAFAMFLATCFAVAITGVGVWLIALTLIETRKAADLAAQTLGEAKDATAAAIDGARITKITGSAQASAFIVITKVLVRLDGSKRSTAQRPRLRFDIRYRVAGPTPAYNIKFGAQHDLVDGLVDLTGDHYEKIKLVSHVQPPLWQRRRAKSFTMLSWVRGPSEADYRTSEKTVDFWGIVVWEDVFLATRGYFFRYRFIGPVPRKKSRKMWVTIGGNRLATEEEIRRHR